MKRWLDFVFRTYGDHIFVVTSILAASKISMVTDVAYPVFMQWYFAAIFAIFLSITIWQGRMPFLFYGLTMLVTSAIMLVLTMFTSYDHNGMAHVLGFYVMVCAYLGITLSQQRAEVLTKK